MQMILLLQSNLVVCQCNAVAFLIIINMCYEVDINDL